MTLFPDEFGSPSPACFPHPIKDNVGGQQAFAKTCADKPDSTRFTGPSAEAPLYDDVVQTLSELNEWRHAAPEQRDPSSYPQQARERVEATYLQATLVLIRPILLQESIDPSLLPICAEFAANACIVSGMAVLLHVTL